MQGDGGDRQGRKQAHLGGGSQVLVDQKAFVMAQRQVELVCAWSANIRLDEKEG